MDLHEATTGYFRDREATIRYLRACLAVLNEAHRRLGGGGGGASPSVLTAGDGADQAPPRGGGGDGLPDYTRFPSVPRAAATDQQPPHVVDDGFVPWYDGDDYFEPPYDDEDEEDGDDDYGDGGGDDDDYSDGDGDDDDYGDVGEDDDDDEGGGGGPVLEYGEAYSNGGFGGVPAAAAAVANLNKRKYHELVEAGRPTSATPGDDDEAGDARAAGCIICMEDFEAGDDLGVMPCSHRFHEACLVEWLALSRLCPCCRHALPSEGQQHQQHV